MTKKRKRKIQLKKLRKECYDLDATFLTWLEDHLKQYLKDATQFINLEYYKFDVNGVAYTQKESIIKILDNLAQLKSLNYCDDGYKPLVDEVLDIWKAVFHAMWW